MEGPTEWAEEEFGEVELGDKRRTKRLIVLAEQRGGQPQRSIAQSCGSKAATKAAYRFLDNEEIGAEAILEGHYEASLKRASTEEIVLAVQDTLVLNYSSHPGTKGLGYLESIKSKGMLTHHTLLVTPQRVALGIIDQQVWVRDEADYQVKREQRKELATAEKESQKWLVSLEATARAQLRLAHTRLINVGDSESDTYDVFRKAEKLKQEVLVRGAWDRKVDHPEKYLWAHLENQALAGEIKVKVARNQGKPTRIAQLEVRVAPVTLRPPNARQGEKLANIAIWAVLAHEPNPPAGQEALEWLLLTTVPTETFDQAVERIQWYTCRWVIETFHKILQSGCRVEERQFRDVDNLQRYLALDVVVAWRVLYMTMLGREVPDLPCTIILETHEWQALYCFTYKTRQLPKEIPTLGNTIGWIAQLGGFLGRKGDGHPGPMSIWQGLVRLTDISLAWSVFS